MDFLELFQKYPDIEFENVETLDDLKINGEEIKCFNGEEWEEYIDIGNIPVLEDINNKFIKASILNDDSKMIIKLEDIMKYLFLRGKKLFIEKNDLDYIELGGCKGQVVLDEDVFFNPSFDINDVDLED